MGIVNKLKNKTIAYVSTISGLALVLASKVSAAADADLASSTQSMITILQDNKGTIITYFVSIFGVVVIVGLAKAVLSWGTAKIIGIMGKRRRK